MSNEELVAEIQKGTNVDYHLSELYKQNLPMIRKQAMHYLTNHLELEDLLQEGYFGLHTAVYKYDPDCGVKFLTYALFWIRQSINRYVQNNGHAIRYPVHLQEKLPDYLRFVSEYQEHNDQPPDRKTICEALRISVDTVTALERYNQMSDMKSLAEPPKGFEDTDLTLMDTIQDDFCLEDSSIEAILTEELRQQLWSILEKLKENQRKALVETFIKGRTIYEVGQDLNLTHQRVQQLRVEAIKKIERSQGYGRLQNLTFDLYGIALRGTGRKVFERTFTSATEHSALMDLRRTEEIREILDQVYSHKDLDRTALKGLLNEMEPSLTKALIVQLVPDPEDQQIMIRKFCEGLTYRQVIPWKKEKAAMMHVKRILDDMLKKINQIQTETTQAGESSSKE